MAQWVGPIEEASPARYSVRDAEPTEGGRVKQQKSRSLPGDPS